MRHSSAESTVNRAKSIRNNQISAVFACKCSPISTSACGNSKASVARDQEKLAELDREKQKFIRKNEKYLVVMIFGAVKAGKSTLGNFFAGKKFINAPFDNPYKHLDGDRKAIFDITDDRGRTVGNLQTDEDGNTWFTEGYIDTTGAIQHFTLLKGLRWMDSPGTGAVAKKGDKKDMTALVEEFIPYTDMCIFLMNSSEPGLQEDMKYMANLDKEGQEALIVITKSDEMEEDVDDNDEIIQVLVPKSDEKRRMQEDSICARVKEDYPAINEKKFRALSVSTLLANEAIKANDEEKFRASNLDKLMQTLGNKVSEDAVKRKRANQQRLFNSFIKNDVLTELDKLEKDIKEIPAAIENFKNRMSEITEGIVRNVQREVRNEVSQHAYEWNAQTMRGTSVGNSTISSTVENILRQALNAEINNQMRRVISDYQSREMTTKANLSATALSKQTTQVEYSYIETYSVERKASGFREKVNSWLFDKKYYTTKQRTRTEYQTIDNGTNFDEFIASLEPQVKAYAQREATASLSKLRDTYFAEREAFARNALGEIKNLRAQLRKLQS